MFEPLESRRLMSASMLVIAHGETNTLSITGTNKRDVIVLSTAADGTATFTVNGVSASKRNITAIKIDARGGNDFVNCANVSSAQVKILGGKGNDVLIGGHGSDVIFDLWGKNTIDGGNGSDVIAIKGVRDTVSGSEGADLVEYYAKKPRIRLWQSIEAKNHIRLKDISIGIV